MFGSYGIIASYRASLIKWIQMLLGVISLIRIREVKVKDLALMGVEVDLPNSPPLILVVGKKGFAMCGFLNLEAAEKVGVAAVMSSGVNSVEELLDATVKGATSKAREMGAELGESVAEALMKMESV